jgi:DNA-binding transcriptional MocR family regulator
MSHAATNWAIQQRGLKPTTKIVLWHLCDRFNPDYGCFPSQERLAQDCEIGRATLNRHLDDLEARGLIRRIRMTDHRTGQQRPTRYLLGFEPGFTPSGSDDPGTSGVAPFDLDPPQTPCPDLRHGPSEENASGDNDLSSQNRAMLEFG